MAGQWTAMAAIERSMYSAGSEPRSSTASSSVIPFGTYPWSASWAEVWSVTMSGVQPRRTSSGSTSAQLATTATDSARRSRLAASHAGERVVEVVGDLVEVAVVEPALRPPGVDLDAQRDAAVAGDGERLGAAHAAETAGQRDGAGEGAAEVLVGDLGEGRERALQDALGADVDPRAGGHLAVHDEAEVLELAEVLGGGPLRHEQRVGDQDPRRALVGAHHADRLAALHQQGVVGGHRAQAGHDGVEALPVAGGPARCRRRRPGRRAARRPRGRGCCAASAGLPRRPRNDRSARCHGGP